eukprot:TRINITY_DN761_c0_g1_i4.p1 TRINITY_DN761_c0_g1~~TRINITY_DN761_c0_g1_i4.p1  ORF type:complete len:422 (+),score=57.65 TRINITY_DN761_c0_g1_i4:44-1309(+)
MKRGRVSSQAVDAVRAGKSQRGEHGRRQLRTRIESDEEPETAVQPAKGVSCSASGTGSGSEDEGLSAKMLLALERARARANGESAHAQKPVSAPKPVKPIDEDDWFMDRKVEEDGPTELPSSPLKGLSPSPVPERTRSPSPVVSRKQITPETGKRQPSRASSSSQEERSRTPERKWRQQPAEAKRSPTPQKRATPSPEPPVPVSVRRSPSPVARRSPSPLARELTPPLPLSVNLLLNFTEADPQRPREVTPSPPRPGAVAAHSTLPIPAAVPTVDPRFVEPGLHTKARHEDGNTYDVEILGAPVDGNVHVWWTQQGRPGNIPLAALHLPTAPQPVPAMHFHAHMHMHAPVMPPAPPAASSSSSDSDSSSSSSSSDDAAINDLIDRSKKRKKDEKKKKKKKKSEKANKMSEDNEAEDSGDEG